MHTFRAALRAFPDLYALAQKPPLSYLLVQIMRDLRRVVHPRPDLCTGKQRALSVESSKRVMVVVGEEVGFRRGEMGGLYGRVALEVAGSGLGGAHGPGDQVTRRGSRPRARCQTA